MKSKTIAILCALALVMILVSGCSSPQNSSSEFNSSDIELENSEYKEALSTKIYTLDQKFLKLGGLSPEEYARDLVKTFGEESFVNIVAHDDSVSVELTEDQRQELVENIIRQVEYLDFEFGEIDENYHFLAKENYSVVDIYYDLNLSPYNVGYYILHAEWLCAEIQIFSGADEWYVEINVYNANTGKLVATGDSEHNVKYNEEDWIRSETPDE